MFQQQGDNMNICYLRTSTDKQENGLESQREMLSSYCKIHGIEIDDYFIDFGFSGKETSKRQKYNDLMDLVKGGKITTIITTSLSRWSRNTLDLLNSIDVLKKHDTDLVVIKENIPSLKTPMGMFFVEILGSVYSLERRLISERTKWLLIGMTLEIIFWGLVIEHILILIMILGGLLGHTVIYLDIFMNMVWSDSCLSWACI